MLNPTTHPSHSVQDVLAAEQPSPPSSSPASSAQPKPLSAPVPSATLLRGHKTVNIAHNGMLYTLQATKMGKLILTK